MIQGTGAITPGGACALVADTTVLAVRPMSGGGATGILGRVRNVAAVGDFSTVTQGTSWRAISSSGSLGGDGLTIGSVPTLASGLSFAVETGTSGQVNLVVVPEPATLVWLLAGGLGITAARRFRNGR